MAEQRAKLQKSSPSYGDRALGRVLGQKGLPFDLVTMNMNPANTFSCKDSSSHPPVNEYVLIARSRGGFTYAQVSKRQLAHFCHKDNKTTHPDLRYRVTYPAPGRHSQAKQLFKDLPAAALGKLTMFDPAEVPAVDSLPPSERSVGAPCNLRDLSGVHFGPNQSFVIDQVVVVPRSAGGFTYGRILEACTLMCDQAETPHKVKGFRVLLSLEMGERARKDISPQYLGKLHASSLSRSRSDQSQASNPNLLQLKTSHSPRRHSDSTMLKPRQELQAWALASSSSDEDMSIESLSDDDEGFESVPEHRKPQPRRSREAKTTEGTHSGGMIKLSSGQNAGMLRSQAPTKKKRTIILDGPNIARKHGNAHFSVKGLKIAIDYYAKEGFDVVAFVPEHYITKQDKQLRPGVEMKDFMMVTTDVRLLEELVRDQLVVLTPPQDYDDSYAIEYAKRNKGCIVTNDLFRDHVEKYNGPERNRVYGWIRSHCISFTFVRDDFLPNPDFQWPDDINED